MRLDREPAACPPDGGGDARFIPPGRGIAARTKSNAPAPPASPARGADGAAACGARHSCESPAARSAGHHPGPERGYLDRAQAGPADCPIAILPAFRFHHRFLAQAPQLSHDAIRGGYAHRRRRQPDDFSAAGSLRRAREHAAAGGLDSLSPGELPAQCLGGPAAIRSGDRAGGGGDAVRHLRAAWHGAGRAHRFSAGRSHVVHAQQRRGHRFRLDSRLRQVRQLHV